MSRARHEGNIVTEKFDKTVIVLYGKGTIGKSTTCKLVKKELLELAGVEVFRTEQLRANKHDINVVLQIGPFRIGIETEGDPGTPLGFRLKDFVNIGCQIIICTCRTYGKTVEVIRNMRPEYEITWINQNNLESDYDESKLRDLANLTTANFIVETLKRRYPELNQTHAP